MVHLSSATECAIVIIDVAICTKLRVLLLYEVQTTELTSTISIHACSKKNKSNNNNYQGFNLYPTLFVLGFPLYVIYAYCFVVCGLCFATPYSIVHNK